MFWVADLHKGKKKGVGWFQPLCPPKDKKQVTILRQIKSVLPRQRFPWGYFLFSFFFLFFVFNNCRSVHEK